MQYRTKRKFSNEFKREAVKLSVSSPKTLVELAGELGIYPGMLTRWRREWIMDKSDPAADKPVKNDGPDKSLRQLEQENKRLKKKLARAELELDILKKLEEYAAKARR